jgi:hypothetical protein
MKGLQITATVISKKQFEGNNYFNIFLCGNIGFIMPVSHPLVNKFKEGYSITLDNVFMKATSHPNGKTYININGIPEITEIKSPCHTVDDRLNDLPDVNAPVDNVRHLHVVGSDIGRI